MVSNQPRKTGARRSFSFSRSRWLSMPLVLVSLIAACSSAPPARSQTVASPQAAPAAPGAGPRNDYIIGPGDTLKISVLQNADLNAEVPVRPDGRISTPLVNDVVAVGRTPTELGTEIQNRLSEFVRAPTVSVIVTHPASAFSQVRVVGQAVAPKAVPFRNGMTVLDLVIEVGGLSQFAAGNRAKIIRVEGQSTRELHVRLSDLLNKGKVSENVLLQPGDILVIPETLF